MTQHILQITDCHLVMPGTTLVGVDTQASLEAVLGQATAERNPDAIIASGDIAHDPVRDVYLRFAETVRAFTQAPMMCLPGNHDVLAAMVAAQLPMCRLEVGRWSLLWLDSHEDELPKSQVTAADRRQVRQAIDASQGQHLLLATHHPLRAVNSPWIDKDRIQNPEELVEWLGQCTTKLRAIVFGHAHQIVEGRIIAGADGRDVTRGLPIYGTPSTCFQFKPRSETFTMDTLSPGYRWLQLEDDGSVGTYVKRVESFPINVKLSK